MEWELYLTSSQICPSLSPCTVINAILLTYLLFSNNSYSDEQSEPKIWGWGVSSVANDNLRKTCVITEKVLRLCPLNMGPWKCLVKIESYLRGNLMTEFDLRETINRLRSINLDTINNFACHSPLRFLVMFVISFYVTRKFPCTICLYTNKSTYSYSLGCQLSSPMSFVVLLPINIEKVQNSNIQKISIS